MTAYGFGVDGIYYEYSGTSNFIQGTGTQNTVVVDWSAGQVQFGFMQVWSSTAAC